MTGINELQRRLNVIIQRSGCRAGRVKLPREMTDAELLQKIREDIVLHGRPELAALSDEDLITAIRNRTAVFRSGDEDGDMGDDPV